MKAQRFRFTDLVGPRSPKFHRHALSTSRYMGVQRNGISRWIAFGSNFQDYIGTFASEKVAALAADIYARREGRPVNFKDETITETEMKKHKTKAGESLKVSATKGKSKYRGVHWQKNRKRWMARYTLAHTGQKNINLGAFLDAKHAALAFDAGARRRGRPVGSLNFPDEHPTDAQIEEWKINSAHYSMMGSQNKKISLYRGVCKQGNAWVAQCNIKKIVEAYGKKLDREASCCLV